MALTSYVIPCVIGGIMLYALLRGTDLFAAFLEGAGGGLKVLLRVLPTIVLMHTAIGMLTASGAVDILAHALAPAGRLLGLPESVLPLALLKPISGGGATALYSALLQKHGPDSFPERVASVLMGSTETTFYTVALYFGAVGVRRTRGTIGCGLAADLTGFIFSALTVSLLMTR